MRNEGRANHMCSRLLVSEDILYWMLFIWFMIYTR